MARTYGLPADVLNRDLVLNFFWRFSVFECALKREGFLRTGRNDSAQPDWDAFAQSIAGRFRELKREEFHDAVRAVLEFSPRRQVVRDGRLAWKEIRPAEGESTEKFVLRLVRAVRNNLFHGGKYPDPDGPVYEVARDKAILEAALAVLDGCYELHPKVALVADEQMNETTRP